MKTKTKLIISTITLIIISLIIVYHPFFFEPHKGSYTKNFEMFNMGAISYEFDYTVKGDNGQTYDIYYQTGLDHTEPIDGATFYTHKLFGWFVGIEGVHMTYSPDSILIFLAAMGLIFFVWLLAIADTNKRTDNLKQKQDV